MEEPDIAVTITGSRATSALRRASMDLTRALADMRGNNRRTARWKADTDELMKFLKPKTLRQGETKGEKQ
jgi:hypothetical protein